MYLKYRGLTYTDKAETTLATVKTNLTAHFLGRHYFVQQTLIEATRSPQTA